MGGTSDRFPGNSGQGTSGEKNSTGAEEPIRRRECMVPDLLFPPSFPLVY